MAATFDLEAVEAALQGTRFAGKLQHFARIDSTNTYALQQAQAGAPDGCVYLADEQSAGRGRSNHTWHSVTGDGLYLSVLLRPQLTLRNALWLALATGLAIQHAIRQTLGVTTDIRWPNDLLVGRRKCGGVLVETAAATDATTPLRYAVVGIGINLNHTSFPAELAESATSLWLAGGQPVSRELLLPPLLRALQQEFERLEREVHGLPESAGLLQRFAASSSWVHGKQVRVSEMGGYTGQTDGLDPQGFLRVRTEDGTVRTVLSGGVREMEERRGGKA
ncbi:MAG: biotin--[acetyl-CoA-carboxylase] ligase [Acidobacteriota bacterium]|nr:biotin--[acetyl-CoA-carboxylase] ligase [Acidobacteriota bacterium]